MGIINRDNPTSFYLPTIRIEYVMSFLLCLCCTDVQLISGYSIMFIARLITMTLVNFCSPIKIVTRELLIICLKKIFCRKLYMVR